MKRLIAAICLLTLAACTSGPNLGVGIGVGSGGVGVTGSVSGKVGNVSVGVSG